MRRSLILLYILISHSLLLVRMSVFSFKSHGRHHCAIPTRFPCYTADVLCATLRYVAFPHIHVSQVRNCVKWSRTVLGAKWRSYFSVKATKRYCFRCPRFFPSSSFSFVLSKHDCTDSCFVAHLRHAHQEWLQYWSFDGTQSYKVCVVFDFWILFNNILKAFILKRSQTCVVYIYDITKPNNVCVMY